jgi:hypothetical protein
VVRTETPWGPWEPAGLAEVVAIFAASSAPWWIAGGRAIGLAVGHPIRDHADTDVVVLRRDQFAVQRVLAGWECWAADPPGTLRPWKPGEWLPFGIHDIWCRPRPDEPWRIQVMLEEASGMNWVSRRDPRISRPLVSFGQVSPAGVPYLAPEVQLLYKAKNPRPKDDVDLEAALPVLTTAQCRWLADRIPDDHPWRWHLVGVRGADIGAAH